ncbi:MAG: hypothetical protein ACP5T2_03200 [Thermoprotei archaeon]
MDQSLLVEKDSAANGKVMLRILMSFNPDAVEVYRVEENLLDVSVGGRYRTRFWFPFPLGNKKVSYFINNRVLEIDLYTS